MNEDRSLEMVRNQAEEPCNNIWLLRKIGKSPVMSKWIGDLALMVFVENARGIVKNEIKKKSKGLPKNNNGLLMLQ